MPKIPTCAVDGRLSGLRSAFSFRRDCRFNPFFVNSNDARITSSRPKPTVRRYRFEPARTDRSGACRKTGEWWVGDRGNLEVFGFYKIDSSENALPSYPQPTLQTRSFEMGGRKRQAFFFEPRASPRRPGHRWVSTFPPVFRRPASRGKDDFF